MRSALPKVLHPLLGRTLLGHVLAATEHLRPQRHVVVVGHGSDRVAAQAGELVPDATVILQSERRGTGHVARIAMDAIGVSAGTIVIINGDLPLLRPETLTGLVEAHEAAGAAATILTAELPD